MNPNIRLALIVVVFVLLGGAIYYFLGDREGAPGVPGPAATAPDTAETRAIAPEPLDADSGRRDSVGEDTATRPVNPLAGVRSGTVRREAVGGFAERGDGILTGQVFDSGGRPAALAQIVLEMYDHFDPVEAPSKSARQTIESDREGRFEFDDLPPRNYFVIARKDGEVAAQVIWMGNSRQQMWDITLRLQAGGAIEGIVRSESGGPVAGAIIHPREFDGGDINRTFISRVAMRTESDQDGKFTVDGLAEGRWKFLVRAEGYASLESEYIPVGSNRVEFVLRGGGAMTGRVTDAATRDPLAGVKVMMFYVKDPSDRHETETGGDGTYRHEPLRAGEYRVALKDDVLVVTGDTQEVTVYEGGETRVDLEAAAGGVLRGRVYDRDTNRGVDGVVVVCQPDGDQFGQRRASEPSSGNGEYEVQGVYTGRHTVFVEQAPGYPPIDWNNRVVVTMQPGKLFEDLDIPLSQGLRIRGRVVDADGAPVAGATVHGRSETWQSRDVARSAAGGQFELKGFTLAAPAFIWAEQREFISTMTGPITPGGDSGDLVLTLDQRRDGAIAGVVVDARGNPVPNIQIMMRSAEHRFADGINALSGGDGTFAVNNVAAGTYQAYLSATGAFMNTADEIRVGPGERITNARLTFDQGQGLSIAGRITDTKGKPLQSAYVNVWGQGGNGYAQSDSEGKYVVTGLQEGEYQVNADHNEHTADNVQNIPAGSTGIDFQLAKNGMIEGRVVNARTGAAIEAFEIHAIQGIRTTIDPWMTQQMARFRDPEGQFTLSRVAVGDATVYARAEGFAPAFVPVRNVPSGDTVRNVSVPLEPSAVIEGVVVSDRGQPVRGAQVFVGNLPDPYLRSRGGAAETGADGAFRLDSLPADASILSAYHPGFAPATVPIGTSSRVQIVLEAGGTVEGRVMLDRKPASNLHVSIQNPPGSRSYTNTQTNAEGRYQFQNVAAGEATVSISQQAAINQWRNASQNAIIAAGQTTVVDFSLEALNATLEGRVTMGGRAVDSGSASLVFTANYGEEQFHSQIGANGTYRFDAVPAGPAQLRVSARSGNTSGRVENVAVALVADRVVVQDIELAQTATISGVIQGGLRAMRGVSVFRGEVSMPSTVTPETLAAFDQIRAGQSQAGADGRYAISGLEPGEYTVLAWSLDGTDVASLANMQMATPIVIELRDGEELNLDFRIP